MKTTNKQIESREEFRKKTLFDIAATAGLAVCAGLFIASAELSVPALATAGAFGAAATGLARIGAEYVKK